MKWQKRLLANQFAPWKIFTAFTFWPLAYLDYIWSVLFKKCHPWWTKFFHCFTSTTSTGVFLYELKLAKVIPLFTSDSSKICSNYRPISILSYISNVYVKKCIKNNQLCPIQLVLTNTNCYTVILQWVWFLGKPFYWHDSYFFLGFFFIYLDFFPIFFPI